MTLSGLIALIAFFTEFDGFAGKYVTVVEYRLIMSANIVSQFQSSTFGHD